jgi:microcystin-dependent protein
MSNPYIGEIRMFGGSFAPAGWAFCWGQIMPISQNDALYTLIGTTYGGDGEETFALPNLAGRVPVHQGQGPGISQNYVLGEMAGVESVTITTQQLPIHNHGFIATTLGGNSNNAPNNFIAAGPSIDLFYEDENPTVNFNANMLTPVGGSQPHENLQPYLAISFIISLFGRFPNFN